MADRSIRVFVASPGDVQRERDSLNGVVNELNRTCDALLGRSVIRLELVRWETDTFPGAGRAQELIIEQIGEYDIFVGILWKRLGTPTGTHASGTLEEFETAWAQFQDRGRPYMCMYFNRAASAPPQTVSDAEQLLGVVRFRERLAPIVFAHEYDSAAFFADTIRPHLAQIVGRVLLKDAQPVKDTESGWASAAARISGRAGTLIAIGPDDACYSQRSKYLGHAGAVIEGEESDGWLRGTFRFDMPLFDGDDGIYKFLQFRVEALTTQGAV